MNRFALTAAMLVVCAGTLLGSEPPPLPKVLPRQLATLPTRETPPEFTGAAPTVDLDELPNSTGAYGIHFERPNALLRLAELRNRDSVADAPPVASSGRRRFQAAPQFSYGGWTSATAGDDQHEFSEPVITVLGQYNTTIAAYMEFPHPNPGLSSRIAVSSHAWMSAPWVKQELALPASPQSPYTQSGDPVIAENPYTTGLFLGRVWVVGLSYNYAFSSTFGDNQVTPWYSDDGGATWQVYGAASGHGYVHRNLFDSLNGWDTDDKPTVAVSWNGATLGYVYVAFVRSRGAQRSIDVYALTPGSSNFEYRSTPVSTTNLIHSPSLSVDAATGNIFLTWIDYSNGGTVNLKYSYAADQGAPFRGTSGGPANPPDLPYSFAAGSLMTPGTSNLFVCDAGTSCVLAASMIMTRANSIGRTVGVAYHRRKNTSGAEVVFNDFDLTTFSWANPAVVSQTGHDTWTPGLDYDSAGNFLITYYDYNRASSPNLLQYLLGATKLMARGERTCGDCGDQVVFDNNSPSNPAVFNTKLGNGYILGEYQDVWYWNNSFSAATNYTRAIGTITSVTIY